MSAPILGERDELLGVVQISRKGVTPGAARPDFTGEELQELERTARRVATLMPEILLTNPGSATDSNCRINRRKNLQASAVTKIGEYQFKAPHCEAQHVIANFEKPQPLARISGQARKSASGGAELFIRLPVQRG
jgi:hypothetical protein